MAEDPTHPAVASRPRSTRTAPPARRTCSTSDASSAALFVIYGVILTVLGLVDSEAQIDKAAGVNINLYGARHARRRAAVPGLGVCAR